MVWCACVCTCVTYVCLEGEGGGGGGSAERKAARRKTDLMPTIVSPRDLTPCSRPGSGSSSRRSPGRASSMTRLDGADASPPYGGGGGGRDGVGTAGSPRRLLQQHRQQRLSSARSMGHLAGGGGDDGAGGVGRSFLNGKNRPTTMTTHHHHRSMIALNPVPPPRLTRAERLRKRAREFATGTCVRIARAPNIYIRIPSVYIVGSKKKKSLDTQSCSRFFSNRWRKPSVPWHSGRNDTRRVRG